MRSGAGVRRTSTPRTPPVCACSARSSICRNNSPALTLETDNTPARQARKCGNGPSGSRCARTSAATAALLAFLRPIRRQASRVSGSSAARTNPAR